MKRIFKFFGVFLTVILARLVPFNWIIGSHFSMFSCTSVVAPVIAAQCGLSWVGLFLCSKKIFSTASILLFAGHRLPLFFSARAFQKRELVISIVLPALCILLFIMHSVGMQVWYYSLYWLIPIGLYWVKDTEWSRALTASFVAHAVGSIVWLYTGSITATTWLALIPVVVCERLLLTGAIVICNRVCSKFAQLYKQYAKQFLYNYKVL